MENSVICKPEGSNSQPGPLMQAQIDIIIHAVND